MSLHTTLEIGHNGVATARLSGRLDGVSHADLDRDLQPWLVSPEIHTIVLELDQLNYISSAGLRSIFRARKALSERSGRLLVVKPQPQIQKVFDIVKAVPLREIFQSVQELDRYLDRIQAKMLDPDLE